MRNIDSLYRFKAEETDLSAEAALSSPGKRVQLDLLTFSGTSLFPPVFFPPLSAFSFPFTFIIIIFQHFHHHHCLFLHLYYNHSYSSPRNRTLVLFFPLIYTTNTFYTTFGAASWQGRGRQRLWWCCRAGWSWCRAGRGRAGQAG